MSGAVKGLAAFRAAVSGFMRDTRSLVQNTAVDLTIYAFYRILEESPQYSGDFVANWQVGYGNTKFKKYAVSGGVKPTRETAFQKGDPEAMAYAANNVIPKLNALRSAPLGAPIALTNSAAHEEPYAWLIENGKIIFRSVNKPGDRPVSRAVYMVRNRFKRVGKSELAFLKRYGV